MIILDENFSDDERRLLELKRIHVNKIGRGIGRKAMTDSDVIPLLHDLDRPTFYTQDLDYYKRRLCHQRYCIVFLDLDEDLLARFVRRTLKHRDLNTKAKRMGLVIRVHPNGFTYWRVHDKTEYHVKYVMK